MNRNNITYKSLKRGFAALVLLSLLAAPPLAARQERQAGQERAPEGDALQALARYPKSEALDSIIESHANRGWLEEHQRIFYATWFPEGNPRISINCTVDEDGQAVTYRDVYDWAMQGVRSSRLTQEKLDLLRGMLQMLPASTESTPLAQLLIVSFKKKGEWTTRIYDRRKVPDVLSEVNEITGAHIATDK